MPSLNVRPVYRAEHSAERRRRGIMSAAMAAFAVVAAVLALQPPWGGPGMRERTDGPYRATIAPDGSVVFGDAAAAFRPGEALGWQTGICTAPDTGMLLQVRLVRLTDNQVLLYRERDLAGNARGCAAARWGIVLPPGIQPGRYQLQRFLLATPRIAPPITRTLPPLGIEVTP